MKVEEVLEKYTRNLMSLPGVIGTGQGICDGKSCIRVFVIKMTSELRSRIPDTLEGYPVRIKETGVIRVKP